MRGDDRFLRTKQSAPRSGQNRCASCRIAPPVTPEVSSQLTLRWRGESAANPSLNWFLVSEAGIWPREADFRSLSQPAISPPATSSTPILPSIKEKGAAAMALGTPGSARDAVVTAGLLPNLYKSDLGSEALLRLLEQRLSEAPDVPTLLATCARSLPRLSPWAVASPRAPGRSYDRAPRCRRGDGNRRRLSNRPFFGQFAVYQTLPQAVGLSKRLLLRLFFSNAGIAAAADFAVYQRKRRLE